MPAWRRSLPDGLRGSTSAIRSPRRASVRVRGCRCGTPTAWHTDLSALDERGDDQRPLGGYAAPTGGLLGHEDLAYAAQVAGHVDRGGTVRGDAEQGAGRRRRSGSAPQPDLVDAAPGRRGKMRGHQLGVVVANPQLRSAG